MIWLDFGFGLMGHGCGLLGEIVGHGFGLRCGFGFGFGFGRVAGRVFQAGYSGRGFGFR